MYAFISDFDGTITQDDFFNYLAKDYFNDRMLTPWREYLHGQKSHFDALNEMFSQIHINQTEFNQFIDKIPLDTKFFKVCELCNEKNIPIYICSAGCDYYIYELIGKEIDKYGITLITNLGQYTKETGLMMIAPPEDSEYFDPNTGISKKNIVKKLKDDDYQVIFAGDGRPDIEPAKISDVVFARKMLLEECHKENIPTFKFNDFDDVYKLIKEVDNV